MRQAYKVAYLGARFHGSQRQPKVRTVEGDLLAALGEAGLVEAPREARFEMASRTDRGVHAMGNVFALDSEVDPRHLIARANRRLQDIWVYAYAHVPSDFRARHARERWYRYYLPPELDVTRLRRASAWLRGRRNFGPLSKGDAGVCDLRVLRVGEGDGFLYLDVRGDRFLRGMVCQVVALLVGYGTGSLDGDDLLQIAGGARPRLAPAPPEYLWLMDVEYGYSFVLNRDRHLRNELAKLEVGKRVEAMGLGHLAERLNHGSREAPGAWGKSYKQNHG